MQLEAVDFGVQQVVRQEGDGTANQGRYYAWSHSVNRCHHGKLRGDIEDQGRPTCTGILYKITINLYTQHGSTQNLDSLATVYLG